MQGDKTMLMTVQSKDFIERVKGGGADKKPLEILRLRPTVDFMQLDECRLEISRADSHKTVRHRVM